MPQDKLLSQGSFELAEYRISHENSLYGQASHGRQQSYIEDKQFECRRILVRNQRHGSL